MPSPGQGRGVATLWLGLISLHTAQDVDKLKGDDPCVSKKPCSFCDILTPEQKLQISTPCYQN